MSTDTPSPQLEALLERLRFYLSSHIDFHQTDNQTTVRKVLLLTAAATYFNTLAVTTFGGRVGPERSPGLVEQAVGAAFQRFGDTDPHPDHFEKAAMLLRGITQGHPFNDGNKRTGFLTAAYYLRLVGFPWPEPVPTAEVVDLCLRVSAGEVRDVGEITQELRTLWGAAKTP